jgi:hypothetical protein
MVRSEEVENRAGDGRFSMRWNEAKRHAREEKISDNAHHD